jgi:NitT/TauT family transport system substrate-binding protein
MYVAQQEGLFEKNGIEVEFIPAGSAPKRDELINAGQADAMINEIVSTLFYNRESPRVQIVRQARTATSNSALFRILASAESGITDPAGLKNVQIGISQGTVIEYLTDRLLQAEGFAPEEIQGLAVPDIGQRMALLGSGELKAAMLPDPLSSLAIAQGARLVLDDTKHPEYSQSVYTFRKDFIDQNPEAVKGFLAAIEEAVGLINADPGGWSDLLKEQKLVAEPLLAPAAANPFVPPQFVTAGVPSEEQWADALAWAKEKGLVSNDIDYSSSVTSEYLP